MNGKFGSIIIDGWSYDGIHYPGVFSSYELEKGNNLSEVEINCLSISPSVFQMIGMSIMRQRSW